MRAIDANTLFVGTNAGRILKVAWNGAPGQSPANVTGPRYISCIAVDPSNPQRYWVTIWQIGRTWSIARTMPARRGSDCTAGLPSIPMNSSWSIRRISSGSGSRPTSASIKPRSGRDLGAFSNGFPNAMAVDLLFHKQDRMLICGTRNRGAWVIPV